MGDRISGLAHCCHHDIHWEYCSDYDKRVAHIKSYKSELEQGLRLKLFKMVPDDKLPGTDSHEWEAYDKAREDYDKAIEAYDKAREACGKAGEDYRAWEAYDKAWEAYAKAREACGKVGEAYGRAMEDYLGRFGAELDTLHKELFPDCPWNGKTIFTRKNEKGEWY